MAVRPAKRVAMVFPPLEVIKEIRRTAQAQWSSEEAAMLVVEMQQRQMGCSLDPFCKRLRAARKAAAAA